MWNTSIQDKRPGDRILDFDRLKSVKNKAKDPMTWNDVHSSLKVCQTARMGWRY